MPVNPVDPSVDARSNSKSELQRIAHEAMLQRGLLPDFSPAVIAESNRITHAAAAFGGAIRDLRGLPWASIDNDDSRDLDQLSVAEPMANGAVKILVAIADVDALVKKGSAIDGHARANTTSVYTAAEIFPMLPEKLSTDLTSLGQDQERLAIVIEMVVAATARSTASDVYRARVRQHAKLAYNGVAAWLEGRRRHRRGWSAVPGLDEQLRIQDRVAQRDAESAALARSAGTGNAGGAGRVRRRRCWPICGRMKRTAPRN